MAEFEYDVAFSFHQADEGLAIQLNDFLQDRFKTFVYTEHQKHLAGTNGEDTFNAVYGQKARVVVVLCRKEWGETPFTRIEQTAIRGRAYQEGYDFALFVPTDDPPTVPKWLPKTQLWFGLKRFGLDGAAAVVEHRIEASGGEPKVEDIRARAERLVRARALKQEQHRFLNSDVGVNAAREAYDAVLSRIRENVKQLKGSAGLPLQIVENDDELVLHGLSGCLHLYFPLRYTNVLEEYPVKADFLSSSPRVHWLMPPMEEARSWSSDRFQYGLLGPDRRGFQDVSNHSREFSPDDLADALLRRYLDLSEKHGERRR